MDSKQLGKNIKSARKKLGITQSKLAEILNVSSNYISAIECGKKTPKLEMFIKIADALNVDFNTLVGDITKEGKKKFIPNNIIDSNEIDALPRRDYKLLKNIVTALCEYFKDNMDLD